MILTSKDGSRAKEMVKIVFFCHDWLSMLQVLIGHTIHMYRCGWHIVASELKDPIWHSLEWQIGSFSSEPTIYLTGFTSLSISIHV